MKKKLFLLLLLFPIFLTAQKNDALWVGSLEFSLDYFTFGEDYGNGPYGSFGVVVEKPIGKFSIASGLVIKSLGTYNFKQFNGDISTKIVDEEVVTYYHYNDFNTRLLYYSMPLRLQYRMPCNCIYVQAGIDVDKLANDKKYTGEVVSTEEYLASSSDVKDLKPYNMSMEIAVGFKLHETKKLRIFMRPAYYLMFDPARRVDVRRQENYQRLKITMGIQYALLRPMVDKQWQK